MKAQLVSGNWLHPLLPRLGAYGILAGLAAAALTAAAADTNIDIGDDFFSPTSVSIPVGGQVQWTWIGSIPHSTTSDTGLWDSGIQTGGNFTFLQTFNSPGQFPFHCTVHRFMTGSVNVQGSGGDAPPTVNITEPADGAFFTAPASFQLAVSASDSDGTVTNVEFFQGAVSLGNVTNLPFVIPVNIVAAGDYSLSAVATDNGGLSATNTITVHVQTPPNLPPIVSITNPVDGVVLLAPASFQLAVSTSDADGTVTNVEFFQGTVSLGNVTNLPFVIPVNIVAAGDYSLSAVATDNGGLSATNTITVHVQTPPNLPPIVSITNPVDGVVLIAPASFQLAVSTSDADGTVTNVEFFQGTVSLGNVTNLPFVIPVNIVAAGDYSLSAVATDNGGLSATNTITVHVQTPPNLPPIVSITNPVDGVVLLAPASFQLAVSASDADGTVTNVEFFQGTVSLGNVTNLPFVIPVNIVAAGDYSLSAVATDNGGLSATNTITVHVQTPPNLPPIVSITNPVDGVVLIAPASFQLAASASDADGTVTNVEFFQGAVSLGNVTNLPFAVPVNIVAAGDYSFSAVAIDDGGLSATNTITVHVQTPPNLPPIVSITNPVDGVVLIAPASFQLAASASDADGTVTNVEFFQGAVSLGNAPGFPFAVSLNNLAAGDYTFSVVATDGGGLTATNAITVHVAAPASILEGTAQFQPPAQFQFSYSTTAGRVYVIWRSADLAAWLALATNTAVSTSALFVDTNAPGNSGFYRIQLLTNQ